MVLYKDTVFRSSRIFNMAARAYNMLWLAEISKVVPFCWVIFKNTSENLHGFFFIDYLAWCINTVTLSYQNANKRQKILLRRDLLLFKLPFWYLQTFLNLNTCTTVHMYLWQYSTKDVNTVIDWFTIILGLFLNQPSASGNCVFDLLVGEFNNVHYVKIDTPVHG